jgi:hypothetical protein
MYPPDDGTPPVSAPAATGAIATVAPVAPVLLDPRPCTVTSVGASSRPMVTGRFTFPALAPGAWITRASEPTATTADVPPALARWLSTAL